MQPTPCPNLLPKHSSWLLAGTHTHSLYTLLMPFLGGGVGGVGGRERPLSSLLLNISLDIWTLVQKHEKETEIKNIVLGQ